MFLSLLCVCPQVFGLKLFQIVSAQLTSAHLSLVYLTFFHSSFPLAHHLSTPTFLLEMATLLLDLRALLLDLRALLVELALPKTTSPSDRYSKLRLGRHSSDSRGLELRYATWQEAFQYIVWFNASCPFCPLLNSYFSHLFRLDLVSTWVKVPHLGKFIWFQYLNFPR